MDKSKIIKITEQEFDELTTLMESARICLSNEDVDVTELHRLFSTMGIKITFIKQDLYPHLFGQRKSVKDQQQMKFLYMTIRQLFEDYSIEGQPGKLDWEAIKKDKGTQWVKSFPFDEAIKVITKVQSGELILDE